ncbi:MAG TPA: DUF3658 domain-containing protein [Candidatus Angelobacter sp.]|nr:DUF3658 domain-containing protein [Candidatus Angelobacter sp.]
MPKDKTAPDRPMEPEDEARARQLTPTELQRIDQVLLSHASDRWYKVARIILHTMFELRGEFSLPDMFYSQRIKHLVKTGALEAVGNLNRIRHSEVRIPPKQ